MQICEECGVPRSLCDARSTYQLACKNYAVGKYADGKLYMEEADEYWKQFWERDRDEWLNVQKS